jgi:hypothetical protein
MAVAVLLSGCGSDAAEESTTTGVVVEEQSETTTTVQDSTTTTESLGPIDICRGRAEVWEAGRTYAAECFVEPVAFVPETDDWNSFGADGRWVILRWADPGSAVTGTLSLLAYRQAESVRSAIDQVLAAREQVVPVSDVRDDTVAGRPALVADVEGARADARDAGPCRDQWELFSPPPIGFQSCAFSRVWAVDAGDTRITVIGTIRDPEAAGEDGPDRALFDRLIPELERLLDSMSFGAS